MSRLSEIVRANRFTPETVPWFEAKLFFEGDRRRPYREQFGMLLTLSTIIATAGVIADSTATVIGAMIVAPLMTPIMATAAALVTGQVPRALRSVGLVVVGVLVVIGLSAILARLYPGYISFDTNAQILGRTSPRVIDLVAALASGAAGAFCMSREDVSDSLPGVAIAISLVPPLCVVGVALSHGQVDDATGAMLLFLANMLAILLAGGALLVLLGLSAARTSGLRGHARRNAFAAIVIAVVAVSVPLAATGVRITQELVAEETATAVAQDWALVVGFTVRIVRVDGSEVSVTVSGPGADPPIEPLAAAMRTALGPDTTVRLETIPSTVQIAGP